MANEQSPRPAVLLTGAGFTAMAALTKAYGINRVAKDASLKRESLHRMLSSRSNPEWSSLFRVMRALHILPKFRPSAGL